MGLEAAGTGNAISGQEALVSHVGTIACQCDLGIVILQLWVLGSSPLENRGSSWEFEKWTQREGAVKCVPMAYTPRGFLMPTFT